MFAEADLAVPASLMGEPARAAMLVALLGGRSLPAGELARIAGVRPATASEHLSRLTAGGLTSVSRAGRHRYYSLSGEHVARAVESLQALAPGKPVRSLRDARTASALAFARTCYDHLAGRLALDIADALVGDGVVATLRTGAEAGLTDPSHARLAELGVAVPVRRRSRRPLVRGCLDWTERRPHLAGQLGADVLDALLQREWLRRPSHGRALRLTPAGQAGLQRLLGASTAWHDGADSSQAATV